MPKAVSRAKKSPTRSLKNPALEELKQKIAALQAENAELHIELAQYIEKWETLDGDAVNTLAYLCRHPGARPAAIAKGNQVNPQIVESYLKFLAQHHYVRAPNKPGQPYSVLQKGVRYLEERGLLG